MSMQPSFFEDNIRKIFTEKKSVLDIGGGLRIPGKKGSKSDPTRAWIVPLLKDVEYRIMDPVPDYEPDIVGDIHALPFADSSQEAIVCIAVLEHVEDPWLACREIRRVLKPGGYAYFYVPFLFYYHADRGYYKDYWRFTRDAVELLMKDFSHVEISRADGAITTWVRISPLGHIKVLRRLAQYADRVLRKNETQQTSGHAVFVVK